MFNKLSTLDAVFITLMAAFGLALKPVVGPIGKLIGTLLFIPGGSISGAIYMIWPMLALLVVRRFGAATMVGLLEGVIVMMTGIYGSHGILSIFTYLIPCVIIDGLFWLIKPRENLFLHAIPTAFGNLSGSFIVAYYIMHVPFVPLLIGLIPAFIFGGLGGILAYRLYILLLKSFPQFSKSPY
ncbi:ECF transporter S component [candidate division KSB1 bacterium]|nr:ECF transporter S component [candidate division KSB1 bacterium]